jgi:hypothetical protein
LAGLLDHCVDDPLEVGVRSRDHKRPQVDYAGDHAHLEYLRDRSEVRADQVVRPDWAPA